MSSIIEITSTGQSEIEVITTANSMTIEVLNSQAVYEVEVQGLFPVATIGDQTLDFTAGENLSSGRAVIKDAGKVYYFDPTNQDHAGRAVGITITSALTNASVTVQFDGVITDAAFAFTVDKPIWIGADGELTTTVPNTDVLQTAGVSVSTTQMIINFNLPLIKQI